jgi:hypothetical protein
VAQAKAEPVRVKLYGFYAMTKRGYVAQVIVAAVLIAFLFVAWVFFHQSLRDRLLTLSVPVLDTIVKVWDAVPWVVLTLAVLQVIEAYFVFRAFARKQPAAAAAPPPPAPDAAAAPPANPGQQAQP